METVHQWIQATFRAIPLPPLEAWGAASNALGIALALFAYTRFTMRLGPRWGLGRERQTWNAQALLSVALTFLVILVAGYLGSFKVLVPGAQTLESLKDVGVFVCIVLFGYPALIAVPFAYGLSDLVEGVLPGSVLDWWQGYFINPACFWVAYQLIGKAPDFTRGGTWARYLLFVLIFWSIEPALWGFICSDTFTPEIAYRTVTPALFFTTSITWVMAPITMLIALPLARRFKLFWAEIPGHVREVRLRSRNVVWEAGAPPGSAPPFTSRAEGLPVRMFLVAPFIGLTLAMVGATAFVTLRSAQVDATRQAMWLREEIAHNLELRLDEYLARARAQDVRVTELELTRLLAVSQSAGNGRAFILLRSGAMVASSHGRDDSVVASAVAALSRSNGGLTQLERASNVRFDHLTDQPSRETWFARAIARPGSGTRADWIVVTLMPESFYLAGVHAGHRRAAMVVSIALLVTFGMGAILASVVTAPLRRLSGTARALAQGELAQRVPQSRLEELNTVATSFNHMTDQLAKTIDELRESEALLRASENRLQLATRAASLGVWDWDIEADQLVWDDSMYEIYGVRRERFSGALDAWSSCLEPADLERTMADLQAALRGEREFSSEFTVRRPDGSQRIVRGVAQTIRNASGGASRMVGVNWDVTEQHRAEQELRRHRDHLEDLVRERTLALERSEKRTKAVLDNLADGVITLDASGNIQGISAAACGIFACAVDEVMGSNVRRLVPALESAPQQAASGRQTVLTGRRKDGSEFPLEVAITEVSIGAERFYTGVVRDISARVKSEDALREAKEQADAANRAKSAFLANMSHEIRTPMNAILGFGQLLERQTDLSPETRDRVARIMASGRHLLDLINNVLEMSKIEAGRTTLNLAPFDLLVLLQDVRLMFGELITARGVSVAFELNRELPRVLEGDAGKVRQVVINLLSNAAKFTDRGGIVLRAASAPLEGDTHAITISVHDTGSGIRPESLANIFDAFDQSEVGARRGGTGLGLTISRNFARLMNGDLTVESRPGEGSTFSFRFEAKVAPALLVADLPGQRVVGLAPGHAGRRVLVVDDEPANAELIEILLSEIGFEVRRAASGEEALEVHALWSPDLVLMDLRMPGIDGLEAIRRLRADGSRAVIVAFTASGVAESEQDARAVGADDFLRKPYRERELLTKIADALGVQYTYADVASESPDEAPASDTSELARLVSDLPPALLTQLREATLQARAERLEVLTASVAEHSAPAAMQIRSLAQRFQYDALLVAFETPGSNKHAHGV